MRLVLEWRGLEHCRCIPSSMQPHKCMRYFIHSFAGSPLSPPSIIRLTRSAIALVTSSIDWLASTTSHLGANGSLASCPNAVRTRFCSSGSS